MKPTDPAAASASPVLSCEVIARAALTISTDQFPALRRQPGPGAGEHLPNNFLKHSDEQTLAGLASVLQAIESAQIDDSTLSAWGIVAAPCFMGRSTLVTAMARYEAEGAWGMSPHFIPHKSQHAVSGTISQALKIHGPNFGTGGSPSGVVDALFNAAVIVETEDVPGVWVVLTGWEPEYVPDTDGQPLVPVRCLAVALGIVRATHPSSGFQICAYPRLATNSTVVSDGSGIPDLGALARLVDSNPRQMLRWPVAGGGLIEVGSRELFQPLHVNRGPHGHLNGWTAAVGSGMEK